MADREACQGVPWAVREAEETLAYAQVQQARMLAARAWLRARAAELRETEAAEELRAAIRRLRDLEA